jgi:peptidoglycan hydrolase CwlO-like protein
MGEVFVEMVKEQGDIANLLAAMEKRQNQTDEIVKSLKAQNETYEKEVKDLRELVNAGPRRPIADAATLVTDAAEVAKAKANTNDEAQDFKDRWGVPMKSGNGSNSNGHG